VEVKQRTIRRGVLGDGPQCFHTVDVHLGVGDPLGLCRRGLMSFDDVSNDLDGQTGSRCLGAGALQEFSELLLLKTDSHGVFLLLVVMS
jgi:hypothetical protein